MEKKIIYYGHQTLRENSNKIETFDKELKDFAEEMLNIMTKAKGIGLAAPQVNVLKRVITIDITHTYQNIKTILINPVILSSSEKTSPYEEGCLSVPGIYEIVYRPSSIDVEAYTVEGKKINFTADSLFARVIQHEIDHLNGVLFVDYLDDYLKKEYTKELKKIRKMN